MDKINLLEKFNLFNEYWNPKIIGELNGQLVKLVKLKGEFVLHHHDNEDELFMVVKGSFKMEYRDKIVEVNEGEIVIVPRGVEHKPVADKEAWIVLLEPATTLNTGNVVNEKTKTELETI
jgi:mannose-6-phosphate isomerase-like protein (cupin superfamily)